MRGNIQFPYNNSWQENKDTTDKGPGPGTPKRRRWHCWQQEGKASPPWDPQQQQLDQKLQEEPTRSALQGPKVFLRRKYHPKKLTQGREGLELEQGPLVLRPLRAREWLYADRQPDKARFQKGTTIE